MVYGPKTLSLSIAIDKKEFETLFKQAGESTVITLSGLDKKIDVLIHDVATKPFVSGIYHVDFYAIAAGQEVTTHVQLEFIGEAPVEEIGGTVTKVLYEIEVTGQPNNLPAKVTVDLSKLTAVDDMIHVSDLVVPKGVVIENAADEVVAVAEGERAAEPESEVPAEAEASVAGTGADAEQK